MIPESDAGELFAPFRFRCRRQPVYSHGHGKRCALVVTANGRGKGALVWAVRRLAMAQMALQFYGIRIHP